MSLQCSFDAANLSLLPAPWQPHALQLSMHSNLPDKGRRNTWSSQKSCPKSNLKKLTQKTTPKACPTSCPKSFPEKLPTKLPKKLPAKLSG